MSKIARSFFTIILSFIIYTDLYAHAPINRQYYEIRIYHTINQQQLDGIDRFLQNSFLPALHRAGIEKVGVFHLIGNDTATDKKIYVLIPLKSLDHAEQLQEAVERDKTFESTSNEYWNIPYDNPYYGRFETILLHAFEDMPLLEAPKLNSAKSERVYELRSYESATEKLNRNKTTMFNKGGEVKLFRKLGFNAVFYAEVVSGSRMPNLMYMTSFENRESRETHWKTFGSDTTWKALSSSPEYQHNVSKADIIFLRATEYSDL